MANRTNVNCRIIQAQLKGYRNIQFNLSNVPPHYTKDPNHLPNVEIRITSTYQCEDQKVPHLKVPIRVQTKLAKSDKEKLKKGADFTPSLCPKDVSRHPVCRQKHITVITPSNDKDIKDEV